VIPGAKARLPEGELLELDRLVERALASGDESELPTLGFGEITLVLGWPAEAPTLACKRLPAFSSRAQFDTYRETLRDYVEALAGAGIRVVPSEMQPVAHADDSVVGYLIQPLLPAATLAPALLRGGDPERGHPLVGEVVAAAAAAVSPSLGIDAQLSNWTWEDERLTYIDVSTPMIWSEDGVARLDLSALAQAYPAILRPPLRRFVAPRILNGYRNLRGVYLDLTGNLLKERLDAWLPAFLEALNPRIGEPISESDVRSYYRFDARLWAALLRIRRLDRSWRHWTGRPYPFLLPGEIER
jgi:Family of unknown function (DUF6206)